MADKFNYYKVNDVYGNLFFQFPKVLMYGQRYAKLSADAKIAYVLLKDRLEYSIRNNWIDQHGNLYFIYPNTELQQLLGCHNQKVIKVKRELEAVNILKQQRMGFNPQTRQNEPNRLYLANLEVLATDVYLRTPTTPMSVTKAGPENVKTTFTPPALTVMAPIGSVKMRLSKRARPNMTSRRNVNFTPQQDEDQILETNRDKIETGQLDFNSHQYSLQQQEQQNTDLIRHMQDFLTDVNNEPVCVSEEVLTVLSKWCQTPQQVHKFIRIIFNAKRAVENDPKRAGIFIMLDEPALQTLLLNTIRRYFNVIRSGNIKINNYDDYLFGTLKNMYQVYWNSKQGRYYRQRELKQEE